MKTAKLFLLGVAAAWVLGASDAAFAGSTMYFSTNTEYRGRADSPLMDAAGSGSVRIENFEDGLLNLKGVQATNGSVQNAGQFTDSIDRDDGTRDGMGRNGRSFSSGNSNSITFRFSGDNKPVMAGLVWTDGHRDSIITFRAWDRAGNLIGKIRVALGDLVRSGTTREDRFLGVASDKGISRIQIASNYRGFEIDHLQFAYGYAFSVVPVPPALALGLAGLAGVGLLHGRRRLIARMRLHENSSQSV